MTRKTFFALIAAVAILAAGIVFFGARQAIAPTPEGDGGAGTGGGILPFASGIEGVVTLGPTCPVVREPADPECADRPYQTTVIVRRAGSESAYASLESDERGAFRVSLPPGDYRVTAAGSDTLPRCAEEAATVGPAGYARVDIACDTGIR